MDAVKNGIKLLNGLINGDINIGDIFQALIDALEALPGKVSSYLTKLLSRLALNFCLEGVPIK